MEAWEKEIINKNITGLVNTTICNLRLMATLRACRILDDDDIEKLINLDSNQKIQVSQLYTILQERINAFEALLEGLQITNQSRAVEILNTGLGKNVKSFENLNINYDQNTILGNGSNGTVVYKGTFGDRGVAVKKVHLFLSGGVQALHEVKIMNFCSAHENIVRYFGAKQTDEFVLIALELCEISLNEWVKNNANNETSTQDETTELSHIEVLRQITVGLEWLHSKKIVHRDIKPENVLLLVQSKQAKLSDFGLSRRVMNGKFVATSNAGGTLCWMSSEILEYVVRRKNSECKFFYESDVFSLGCVYYYVLSDGKYAFGDSTVCEANILDGNSLIMESEIKHVCKQSITFMHYIITTMTSKDLKCRLSCKYLSSYAFWSHFGSAIRFLDNTVLESVHRENSGGVGDARSNALDCEKVSICSSAGRLELVDVNPGSGESDQTVKLRYDGSFDISNEDGKLILKRVCLNLTRELNSVVCNERMLLIFKDREIIDGLESDAIKRLDLTSTWVTEFCKLLENRYF